MVDFEILSYNTRGIGDEAKGKRYSTTLKEILPENQYFFCKKLTAQSKSKTCGDISGMVI